MPKSTQWRRSGAISGKSLYTNSQRYPYPAPALLLVEGGGGLENVATQNQSALTRTETGNPMRPPPKKNWNPHTIPWVFLVAYLPSSPLWPLFRPFLLHAWQPIIKNAARFGGGAKQQTMRRWKWNEREFKPSICKRIEQHSGANYKQTRRQLQRLPPSSLSLPRTHSAMPWRTF